METLLAILLPAGGLLRNKDVRLRAGLRGVIGRSGKRAAWARGDRFQVVPVALTHVRALTEHSGSASWFVDPDEGPAFRFSAPLAC